MNKVILIIFLIFISIGSLFAQSVKNEIVVLGVDTTRFYSNVVGIDKLGDILNVETSQVIKPYKMGIESTLSEYDNKIYNFSVLNNEEEVLIRPLSKYITLINQDDIEYLAIAPTNKDQTPLFKLLKEKEADFYLTINLIEMLSVKDEDGNIENIDHVIHYDLFTSDLKLIYGSVFIARHPQVYPQLLDWIYNDFALEIIFMAKAYQKEGDFTENLLLVRQEFEEEKFSRKGRKGFAVSTGLSSPLGVVGLEYNIFTMGNLNYTMGVGYDFSGFKAAVGMRYFLKNFSPRSVPFLGWRYSFNSGNRFEFYGAQDEFGNYLYGDERSVHRISQDHTISLQTGVQFFVDQNISIAPFLGFGFPLLRNEPELISGKDSPSRNNFVEFLSPGGINFGIIFMFFK